MALDIDQALVEAQSDRRGVLPDLGFDLKERDLQLLLLFVDVNEMRLAFFFALAALNSSLVLAFDAILRSPRSLEAEEW